MNAKEALAISNVSQSAIKENVEKYIYIFLNANLEAIRKQAKQGYKSLFLRYQSTDHPVETVGNEAIGITPKKIILTELESRIMRRHLTDQLQQMGYLIKKTDNHSIYTIFWGFEE